MSDYTIYVPPFFENALAFPWDIMGYGVPKAGPVHSYLCTILAPLANQIEKPFLMGRPSFSEIGRLAQWTKYAISEGLIPEQKQPFVCGKIHEYCSEIYSSKYRTDVAQEVLNCLRRFEQYQNFLKSRLDSLWRQGLISIPGEYLRPVVTGEKQNQSWY